MCKCDGTELMPCTCSLAGAPAKPTPHVHAELIKTWAEGANIEYFSIPEQKWKAITQPTWYPDFQYRIKPEPKKIPYRLCLWENGIIYICLSEDRESNWQQQPWFKKWITPWQYYIEEEA